MENFNFKINIDSEEILEGCENFGEDLILAETYNIIEIQLKNEFSEFVKKVKGEINERKKNKEN